MKRFFKFIWKVILFVVYHRATIKDRMKYSDERHNYELILKWNEIFPEKKYNVSEPKRNFFTYKEFMKYY